MKASHALRFCAGVNFVSGQVAVAFWVAHTTGWSLALGIGAIEGLSLFCAATIMAASDHVR